MTDNSVIVKSLNKKLGTFHLKDVSFSIPRGRIVGFIGENGAGKSTTINLVLDVLKKDSGSVEIFGKPNTDYSVKNDIGVVFDECNFPEVFTPSDMGKILSGVYSAWDSELYLKYLNQFQLPLKKPIGTFSKGMKMKLSIICAISHHPKLLIMDEATTGLDPVVRDEILDLFLDFIQDEENALFFSSHIISDIEKVADYVILIHLGELIFEEQKDSLIYNYGIAKCGKEAFAAIDEDDYLISRNEKTHIECLVADKVKFKKKYSDIIVDNAALENIMLFYLKRSVK